MAPTGAVLEEKKTTVEDDAKCVEMTTARNLVRHIHHHAYACWDSEETRHFYEDILGMPLIATAAVTDSSAATGMFAWTSWTTTRPCFSSQATRRSIRTISACDSPRGMSRSSMRRDP